MGILSQAHVERSICIHGHFYQPPRENPWLEEIEQQPSAAPYHDWNERITAECYTPNTAARILNEDRTAVSAITNNFSSISFNIGPTLLHWMQQHAPEVYAAILHADRESCIRFAGHGAAIAQAYNHIIMPLAVERDKRTQIRWGIRDFEMRFGRKPEGMWLPETAVDLETLDLLTQHAITFTILAPHQARRIRSIGGGPWKEVSGGSINPTMPYMCRLPSGRMITLFFYDAALTQEVAFKELLSEGRKLAEKLLHRFDDTCDTPQLVHIATDGETYGHHHRHGEMALASCIHHIASHHLVQLNTYSAFLAAHPPLHEVEILERTSWSCPHGVKHWSGTCTCTSGKHPDWQHEWRGPLREAMDWLRDALAPLYEQYASGLLRDPWAERDAYIDVVLDRSEPCIGRFLSEHALHPLSTEEKMQALSLLEMQRHALLMYTSCGWFFDDIAGIEAVQVMQYACRAMQLAEGISGVSLEEEYLQILSRAPSNDPEYGNGAVIYQRLVVPKRTSISLTELFKEHAC